MLGNKKRGMGKGESLWEDRADILSTLGSIYANTITRFRNLKTAIRYHMGTLSLSSPSSPSLLVATSVACTTGYTFYLHYI